MRTVPVASYLGWKQVGGWTEEDKLTAEEINENLLDHPTILESYVQDKYYGEWYHNTGLLTVTAFLSWLVARLGGGLPWVFLILIFTATAYRTSIRRLRRNIREKVAREAAMRKLETDTESLDWLNLFMNKFWTIFEPVLAELVTTQVNKVLTDAAPAFLSSLAIDTFTLGSKPPRLNHVRTFPKSDEDIVVMDWMYSFTPNDTLDMTAMQLKTYVNPLIELCIGVGKGAFSAKIPIVVHDMAFSGLMRLRIKLVTSYPHVKTVDAYFLEAPSFDYVMKPVGGNFFGFDINSLPGFSGFVKSMVDSILGPMLYAPNSFQVNIQELLAGAGAESAAGVLAVTVFGANALKGSDAIGNTVDPYITFSLNNRTELARSEIKKSTKNPRWNETKYVLVQNLSEALTMTVIDFNDFRKDKVIGMTNYPLEGLASKPDVENLALEVMDGTKSKGTMNCELHWFPVLEGKKLDDGTVEPPPESNTGIVKLIVHQCKDIDSSQSMVGQLSPYTVVLMNGKPLIQTKPVKRNNSPVWDQAHEFLVPDRRRCKIGFSVKDSRGLSSDPVLGNYSARLDNILTENGHGNDWFNLSPLGRIRVSASWKPVALKGTSATRSYAEPIGVIRLHCIKSGDKLRNLETIGKVDPYIRVLMNGFQRARTLTIPNTLEPVWNEVVYIPVQSPSQRMVIEAMDTESLGSDRTLGEFELDTTDFIKTNAKGEYVEFADETVRTGQFSMKKKGPKGTLLYTLSFFPAVNVMSPDEAEELRQEAEKKAQEAAEAAANGETKEEKEKPKEEEKPKDEDAKTLAEPAEPEEPAAKDIPLDELIKNDSGIIAITIQNVQLAQKDVYLRTVVDDAYFSSFTTPKITKKTQNLEETGELLIRELGWSQLTFQVTEKPKNPKKDEIISTLKVGTLNVLKKSYLAPYTIQLKNGERTVASFTIRMRYFPVLMQLNPSESINNMGLLSGEIIKADNVAAADRSGYSDPYAVVLVNGEKVFKTKTIKKTLNPVWNEQFDTEILSRTSTQFLLQVFDWDLGPGDDDFLGDVEVDLAQLEPLTPLTLTLPLKGESGTISVKFLFKPSYVTRRIDSSGMAASFSGAPVKIIGSAVGGAGAITGGIVSGAGALTAGGASEVAGGLSNIVGGVGSGLKSGTSRFSPFKRSKQDLTTQESFSSNNNLEVPGAASSSSNLSSPGRTHRRSASMMSNVSASPEGATSGQITIYGATGFNGCSSILIKAYLSGKKEKEVHKTKNSKVSNNEYKFDETFPFKASATETNVVFKVKEHKSLGRTEDLGEVSVSLTEIATGSPVVLPVGDGQITVSMAFNV